MRWKCMRLPAWNFIAYLPYFEAMQLNTLIYPFCFLKSRFCWYCWWPLLTTHFVQIVVDISIYPLKLSEQLKNWQRTFCDLWWFNFWKRKEDTMVSECFLAKNRDSWYLSVFSWPLGALNHLKPSLSVTRCCHSSTSSNVACAFGIQDGRRLDDQNCHGKMNGTPQTK